ncbi:MAG: hypothetical protein HY286_10735 [Planctomycetes bacterium]|nr:hypothetical protein [Planctomycetota bacterium]
MSNPSATARRIAAFTTAAFASFGLIRCIAASAHGTTPRAYAITTSAAIFCYGLGTLLKPRGPRWVAVSAAIVAVLLYIFQGMLESISVQFHDERGLVESLLTFALCAIPFATLGKFGGEAPIRWFGDACLASAIAIFIMDGPFVPEIVANGLALSSPLLLLMFERNEGAADSHDSGESRWAALAAFLGAFALASNIMTIRVEARSLLRADLWSLSFADIVSLILAGLGAWLVGGYIHKLGVARASVAIAVCAASFALAFVRITTLGNREVFDSAVQRITNIAGSAFPRDGALFPATVVVGMLPIAYVAAGAFARGCVTFTRAGVRPLLFGFSAGIFFISIIVNAHFGSLGLAQAEFGIDFAEYQLYTNWIWGAAAFAGCAAMGSARSYSAIFAFFSIVVAYAILYFLPPRPFFPNNLVNSSRSPIPDIQYVFPQRASVDGLESEVETPDFKNQRPRRSVFVKIDGAFATPGADQLESHLQADARAVAIHGHAKRILRLWGAEPTFRAAEGDVKSPMIAFLNNYNSSYAYTNQSDLDLIIWLPRPGYLADTSLLLESRRMEALISRLAPDGMLAIYVDLSSTPADVVRKLILRTRPGESPRSTIFVSDGLRAPLLGILIRKGRGPVVADNINEILAGFNDTISSLPANADLAAADLRPDDAENAAELLDRFLPKITISRNYPKTAGRDYYDSGPRETRRANAELLERIGVWRTGSQRPSDGQTATLAAIRALAALESEHWTLSPLRTPLESQPIPAAALDEIVNCAGALPGNIIAKRAFLQLSENLRSQSKLALLESFAARILKTDPGFAEARAARSFALRGLLDPEGARAVVDEGVALAGGHPHPVLVVEQAACEFALGFPDQAISILKRGLTSHPVDVSITRALVETLLAAGNPSEANTYATHLLTLSPGDASAREMLDRTRRAGQSRPSSGPTRK